MHRLSHTHASFWLFSINPMQACTTCLCSDVSLQQTVRLCQSHLLQCLLLQSGPHQAQAMLHALSYEQAIQCMQDVQQGNIYLVPAAGLLSLFDTSPPNLPCFTKLALCFSQLPHISVTAASILQTCQLLSLSGSSITPYPWWAANLSNRLEDRTALSPYRREAQNNHKQQAW